MCWNGYKLPQTTVWTLKNFEPHLNIMALRLFWLSERYEHAETTLQSNTVGTNSLMQSVLEYLKKLSHTDIDTELRNNYLRRFKTDSHRGMYFIQ